MDRFYMAKVNLGYVSQSTIACKSRGYNTIQRHLRPQLSNDAFGKLTPG